MTRSTQKSNDTLATIESIPLPPTTKPVIPKKEQKARINKLENLEARLKKLKGDKYNECSAATKRECTKKLQTIVDLLEEQDKLSSKINSMTEKVGALEKKIMADVRAVRKQKCGKCK